MPIGVSDLARSKSNRSINQLVAGREHANGGPTEDRNLHPSDTGQHPDVAWFQNCSWRKYLIPRPKVLTSRPNVVPRSNLHFHGHRRTVI